MSLIDCTKCNRRSAQFDPRCKSFICLMSDCNHSWKEPEKPTVETMLAMLKPLVFRQAESAHGEVKFVADTPFGRYEIIGNCVWFNNRMLFQLDQPQEASELDYQSRVRALFEECFFKKTRKAYTIPLPSPINAYIIHQSQSTTDCDKLKRGWNRQGKR